MRRYRVTNPLYGNGPTAGLRPGQTRNLRLSDRGRAKMESAGVVVECITPTVAPPSPAWGSQWVDPRDVFIGWLNAVNCHLAVSLDTSEIALIVVDPLDEPGSDW